MTVRDAEAGDVRAITRLMTAYARLIDAGDFPAVAELFRYGEWFGQKGYEAVLEWFESRVILYDGSPRTQHLVTNVDVRIGDDASTATAHSYITVLHQRTAGEAPVIITSNAYDDEFLRVDGDWRFVRRDITRRLVGDIGRHRLDSTT